MPTGSRTAVESPSPERRAGAARGAGAGGATVMRAVGYLAARVAAGRRREPLRRRPQTGIESWIRRKPGAQRPKTGGIMVRASRWGLTLVLLLFVAAGAFAQSSATTGTIQGRVADSNGSGVASAAVVLTNTGTNFERGLATDSGGRFRGILLPLGTYRVEVTADGYATLIREGVSLAVGQTIDLVLIVQPVTVEESITVTGEAPVIEVSRTQGQVSIDTASIEGLPN